MLGEFDGYADGVVAVPEAVDGTAFFAAGPGLYCEAPPSQVGLPPFPFGGVMFVGHNLDVLTAYQNRLAQGRAHGDREHPMATWRGLYRLLPAAGVEPTNCFFTNAYVGLIEKGGPTGRFPGESDPTFVAWCEGFLRLQIDRMRPSVLVALGAPARRFCARLSPDLAVWSRRSNINVAAVTIDGHRCRAVALAHPSMYPVSARLRSYDGEVGVAADAALLHAACGDASG